MDGWMDVMSMNGGGGGVGAQSGRRKKAGKFRYKTSSTTD